ncbi:MAG: leucine-rich repeat domain-containing protein, partial [Saprospiraceae bacterium]
MSNLALELIAKEKIEKTGRLDLGNCGLTELPEELFELVWLEELYLNFDKYDWENRKWIKSKNQGSKNQISHIPTNFPKLENLKELQIHEQPILDFSILNNCKNLVRLNLYDSKTTDFSFLSGLTQLQSLYLSSNQITDISFLSGLTQLQSLVLSSNQITDISFLSGLTQLQTLDLSSNQITDISDLLPLIKLGKMQLSLEEYDWKGKINLHNNPIENPPLAIVKEGNEAVINYFKQKEKQGTFPLLEAKLLIVGEAGSGKSSLMKKLVDNTYVIPKDGDKAMKSTVGIKIHEGWTFPYYKDNSIDFITNLWDFGGQEVQYMTHQFFM